MNAFTATNRRTFLSATLAAILALSSGAVSEAQNTSLPELGDASTRFLNSQQEEDIGKQFLQQLLGQDTYIADPFLRHFLNDMGARIGEGAALGGQTLEFNLLEEGELNAFAVPGGYITFNSGLILTTETESELASVVGHEIAHLSQRHLPRLIARQEAQKLPTTAAILAAILVGGQAGVAGVTLAQANVLSNRLAYSREFEREADAIGLRLMAASDYDPRAMGSFFAKLQRFNLVSSRDVPEFLRTHPLSYTRVAEAESRQAKLPARDVDSSLDFLLVRARIQALYDRPPADAITNFDESLRNLSANSRAEAGDALRYGKALAQGRLREFDSALEILDGLKASYPDNAAIGAAHAEVLAMSGDLAGATSGYSALASRHPELDWVTHVQIEALLRSGDAAEARKIARYQLRRNPNDFRLYPKLSEANVGLGQLALAHQADAEYLAAIGKYREAVSALRLALRENNDKSDYITKSVEARVQELEAQRLDAERRQKN